MSLNSGKSNYCTVGGMSGARAATAGPDAASRAASRLLTGYARAGDGPAALEVQQRRLREAGCAQVYTDESADRSDPMPGLRECLHALQPGAILVVTRLDQIGRTQREVVAVAGQLRRRGVALRSLHEELDTTAPGGDAVFRVFDALAELSRTAASAATSGGLAAARARGTRLGRPPALTNDQLGQVRELLTRPDSTVAGVARQLGVSRSTLYKYLPDAMRAAAGGPSTGAGAHLAPYQARPGRRALVIDRLDDLHGPVTGRVELPLRLNWSLPGHQFDLDDLDMRLWYYQTVLREASRPADLASYLDGATLIGLWPELYLPAGVRRAWEEQHEPLRAAVRA